MSRSLTFVLLAALAMGGCGADATDAKAAAEAAAVTVSAVTAAEQPIMRFIRVSGTLTPQEDAEVAAGDRRPRRRDAGRTRQRWSAPTTR